MPGYFLHRHLQYCHICTDVDNVSNSRAVPSGSAALYSPSDEPGVMSVSDESESCGFCGDGENNKLG